MIVGKCFNEDTDKDIKSIQHKLYNENIFNIFGLAKKRFIKASGLINTDKQLVEEIKKIDRVDHRIYQFSHDLIASYFRYAYSDIFQKNKEKYYAPFFSYYPHDSTNVIPQKIEMEFGLPWGLDLYPSYPALQDCWQLDMFKKNQPTEACITRNWLNFYHQELLYLIYNDDNFAKASIIARQYQNRLLGYEAEDIMIATLYNRYDCWSWYDNHNRNEKTIFENTINQILKKDWNLNLTQTVNLSEMIDGFVYILKNPLFKEDILKIGKTRRNANERAKEISRGTGIPVNFIVLNEEPVVNCDLVEKLVHQKLTKNRVNKGREFFNVSQEEALRTIKEANEEIAMRQVN